MNNTSKNDLVLDGLLSKPKFRVWVFFRINFSSVIVRYGVRRGVDTEVGKSVLWVVKVEDVAIFRK